MKSKSISLRRRLQRVRCLLMDVDGVLTDGGIHLTSDGQEFKTFNVLDGHGIAMAQRAGILVGFISGRPSPATARRAQELGVGILKMAATNKAELLAEVMREHDLNADEIAYVGDELVDLPVLRRVGCAVAVPNAVHEVREVVHHVTKRRGGDGAIREVVEMLLKARGLWREATAKYFAVVVAVLSLAAGSVLAMEGAATIEKFEVPERDANGNLIWNLKGERAQLGTNGLMTVVNARAEMYQSNKVSAVFTTPACVLDRVNNRATTDAPVRLERGNVVITGIGGEWDGKASRVTIRSNVQMVITGGKP